MLKILNIFKMPQGHKESHKKTVSGGWHIWEHKPEWGAEVGQLVSVRWRGGRNSLLYQLTFILLFTNKSCAETKMTGFYLQTSGWHACKTERDLQCLQHILQLRRFGGLYFEVHGFHHKAHSGYLSLVVSSERVSMEAVLSQVRRIYFILPLGGSKTICKYIIHTLLHHKVV